MKRIETDFRKVIIKINGSPVKGRNVHRFFVTDKEFEKIIELFKDNHSTLTEWKTETIYLMRAVERGITKEQRKITTRNRIFGF